MDKYWANCKKCRHKTMHIISKVSRSRGVKLICIECGNETNNYSKIPNLVKFDYDLHIKEKEEEGPQKI